MTLSAEQKEFYAENGYLVIEGLFGDETLTRVRNTIQQFISTSRCVSASNAIFDIGPGHSPDTPVVRRVKDPHKQHQVFDDVMRAPELMDIVAELMGGTVRFDHSKLNFKPAGGNAQVEWHQDWAFYPHTNDDLLAVGVMVEDCTHENGPLMVVPGSHRGPVFDHHHRGVFAGGIARELIEEEISRAVELTAPAGSVSIHHVRTLHGSRENLSQSTRPLLLFSYASVDAFPVFAMPDWDDFDSRILRGDSTLEARMVPLPIRIPEPRNPSTDSIYDNQDAMDDGTGTMAVMAT